MGSSVAVTVKPGGTPTVALVYGIFLTAGALVTIRMNTWVAALCLFRALKASGYVPAAAFVPVPEIIAMPPPWADERHS